MDWTAASSVSASIVALFTAILAWATLKLARASRRDIEAQWTPVVLGVDGAEVTWDPSVPALRIPIANVGRGPALEVTGVISTEDAERGIRSAPRSLGPGSRAHIELNPREFGIDWMFIERWDVPLVVGSETDRANLVVRYVDIIRKRYHESIIIILRDPQHPPPIWIQLSTYVSPFAEGFLAGPQGLVPEGLEPGD